MAEPFTWPHIRVWIGAWFRTIRRKIAVAYKALATRQARRELILASLEQRHRSRVRFWWSALILLVALWLFYPLLFLSIAGGGGGNPDGSVVALPPEAQARIERLAPGEIARIRSLGFIRDPRPPAVPPRQAPTPRSNWFVGAVAQSEAAEFATASASLDSASAACANWQRPVGAGDDAPAGGSPPGIASAVRTLRVLRASRSADQVLNRYHSGIALLCGPNSDAAAEMFRKTIEAIGRRRPLAGNYARALAQLAQYEAVAEYGLGVALLRDTRVAGNQAEAARAFDRSLEAASKVPESRRDGPFVEFSRSGCPHPDAPPGTLFCDMFVWSTAEVLNAKLFALLQTGKFDEAYQALTRAETDTDPGYSLPGSLEFVARHPALAANLAAAAAAHGDVETVQQLFAIVRSTIAEQDEAAEAWTNSAAVPQLSRLAALAAMTNTRQAVIYDEDDRKWWPVGQPSSARQAFGDVRGRDHAWFPPIGFAESPSPRVDANSVDLWLWIHRERALLRKLALKEYQEDGLVIDGLPAADDKAFLQTWRTEIAGALSDVLLRQAEQIRDKNNVEKARPLYQFLTNREFPTWTRLQARIALDWNWSPSWVLLFCGTILLILLTLMCVHLSLNKGYSRTFTRRHHVQRTAWEAAQRLEQQRAAAASEQDESAEAPEPAAPTNAEPDERSA